MSAVDNKVTDGNGSESTEITVNKDVSDTMESALKQEKEDKENSLIIHHQFNSRRPSMESFAAEELLRRRLRTFVIHLVHVITPVTACLLLVVFFVDLTNDDTSRGFKFEEQETDPNHLRNGFLTAVIYLSWLIVITFIFACLFVNDYHSCIKGTLLFAGCLILILIPLRCLRVYFEKVADTGDWITVGLFLWNFSLTGIFVIHWPQYSPLLLNQTFLVISCSLLSLDLIRILPDFIIWILLGLLIFWDIFAVLFPCGPLRKMVDKANDKENKTPFPTGSAYLTRLQTEPEGHLLGLRDFTFYSVLIGKVASYFDYWSVVSCSVSLLFGLITTITISPFMAKKGVPVLPISLSLAIVVYLVNHFFATPFSNSLALHQVYV